MTLDLLKKNDTAEVIDILSEDKIILISMGILKGDILKVIFESFLGSPIVFSSRENLIALRKEQAQEIVVTLL